MTTSKEANQSVKFLKLLMLGICIFMTYTAISTSIKSDLWTLCRNFHLQDPWFGATLWDFYFNITIISLWTIYKENNAFNSAVWIVAFVLLGSIATSIYVLRQLSRLKPGDSWEKIWSR